MAFSPESMPENLIDFRAPPPSPIAAGRRSSLVANDDILTDYLEHSLRVPDLVLPDNIFPRQIISETPPVIDFRSLNQADADSIGRMLDSLARIGCFQLVNYEIPSDSIELVLALASGIFSTPPEKRSAVMRSPERAYGFEEVHGEEEESEEFVWCRDEDLKLDMEAIWPHSSYSNFSEKVERLVAKMEKVGEKIMKVVEDQKGELIILKNNGRKLKTMDGSMCYFHKHKQRHNYNDEKNGNSNSLGYEVIRMLIRGSDYSHSLCFHLCDSSNVNEFHVYSKKGWISFCPHKHAIVVTLGDLTQVESGGKYKQVVGRPIVKKEDSISMAFLYSPNSHKEQEHTFSLLQQLIFALLVTFLYQFFCLFF